MLVGWENEAMLAIKETGKGGVEIVVPSISILAEPPVAWVDKVVRKRGTTEIAKAYLEFLYTPEGQEIAARNIIIVRDSNPWLQKYAANFPKLNLFTIDEVFGGWQKAQKTHFTEGGVFDQIQRARQ